MVVLGGLFLEEWLCLDVYGWTNGCVRRFVAGLKVVLGGLWPN